MHKGWTDTLGPEEVTSLPLDWVPQDPRRTPQLETHTVGGEPDAWAAPGELGPGAQVSLFRRSATDPRARAQATRGLAPISKYPQSPEEQASYSGALAPRLRLPGSSREGI